jgi:FdrA protein
MRARKALSHGTPVQTLASEKRLLLMGPDCGTSVLDGVPMGFCNRVRRGSVGLVGASGTGLQQVSTLIHLNGGGVSQMIGVGG